MDRLHHLQQTLPKNIMDNHSYGDVEFVVLDYNSKDGLEEWVQRDMAYYLKSGVLVYYKTKEPKYFLRSHSKNIAAKLATGAIACNIDADNYIGKGFAEYVSQQFVKDKNCYLAVQRNSGKKDCYGRICTWKKDFMAITGYDESMTDYGFEDFDLLNRLDMLGRKPRYITDRKYLKVLEHEDVQRIENESHVHKIERIYIRYINHYSSELVYLFKNGTFYSGIVLVNRFVNSSSIRNIFHKNRMYEYVNSLQNNVWKKGNWSINDLNLTLKFMEGNEIDLIPTSEEIMCTKENIDREYHQCHHDEIFEELIMFLSQIKNRIKMLRNKSEKRIRVNEVFGEIDHIERWTCGPK